jgi:hypothetical protein
MPAGWNTNKMEWDALLKGVVKVHFEMQSKA